MDDLLVLGPTHFKLGITTIEMSDAEGLMATCSYGTGTGTGMKGRG